MRAIIPTVIGLATATIAGIVIRRTTGRGPDQQDSSRRVSFANEAQEVHEDRVETVATKTYDGSSTPSPTPTSPREGVALLDVLSAPGNFQFGGPDSSNIT